MLNRSPNAATPNHRGFSLVELMVAMALSVVLLSGVISIYTNSKQTYNRQEGLSRLQENARFAMGKLSRQVSAAGYLGCLQTSASENPLSDKITNVLSDQTGYNDFARPVFGVDGGAGGAPDTITLSRANAGTAVAVVSPMANSIDSLTLDTTQAGYAGLELYDVITVSDCSHASTFMISAAPSAGVIEHGTGATDPDGQKNTTEDLEWAYGAEEGSLAVVMELEPGTTSTIYSIGTSAAGILAGGACGAGTPGFCALFEGNNELVEGVEDMQIVYGEDTDINGDARADVYRDAGTVGNWDNVVSVKITLTINQVERVQGGGGGQTDDINRTYERVFRLRSRGA